VGYQGKAQAQGFIETFCQVYNIGPKLIDMAFSHLFFAKYPGWDYQRVGAEMVDIDTLVHNFLARPNLSRTPKKVYDNFIWQLIITGGG